MNPGNRAESRVANPKCHPACHPAAVRALIAGAMIFMTAKMCAADTALDWRQLPPLPDPVGFAGPFAGVSSNALFVAGGANFPDKLPWEGGRKIWYDAAFVLDRTNGAWSKPFKLPRAIGYGVSVTTPDGVLCAGGSDSTQHYLDVFLLRWCAGKLETKPLPPLPKPLANSCGALVGLPRTVISRRFCLT